MNEKMYLNKVVKENIEKLKKLKYKFIGPVRGHLACGYPGIGHIAPVDKIITEAKKAL
jgi:phosphopantothenoylcysteine synthetase/decarboxylase